MSTTLIVVASVAGMSGILYFVRLRILRQKQFHFCRCPECGQKLRYPASRAGRESMCPRCRQRFILPRDAEPLSSATTADGYEVRAGQRRLASFTARRPDRFAGSL